MIDPDGALLTMSEISLHKANDELRCAATDTRFGARDGDHAHVGPSKLAFRRNEGAWKLRALGIEHGNLRSLRSGSGFRGRSFTTQST